MAKTSQTSTHSTVKTLYTLDYVAYGDLARGAQDRLKDAAWRAKLACERICNRDGDMFAAIQAAVTALGEASQHANALQHYCDRQNEQTGKL